MAADSFTECWLCNVNHDDDTVVEIHVNMPTRAVLCTDCLDCVLKWAEVAPQTRDAAQNKMLDHTIHALRTKAASGDHH